MVDAIEDLLPQGNRLQILTPEEYELLWGVPQFTASERELFFTLTPREQAIYDRLRSQRTRLPFSAAPWLFQGETAILRPGPRGDE